MLIVIIKHCLPKYLNIIFYNSYIIIYTYTYKFTVQKNKNH